MPTPSTIAAVTAAGRNLANLKIITTAAAIVLAFRDAADQPFVSGRFAALHLYGPGRKRPEDARLTKSELPANLPPGEYQLSARLKNEDALLVSFTVAAATDSDPDTTPGNDDTTTPPPSHLIKGICTDWLVPADTKIVRLDGSIITAAEWHGICRNKVARLWCSVKVGAKLAAVWMSERITWAKANGFHTLIICTTPKDGARDIVPTASQTKAWFQYVAQTWAKLCNDAGIRLIVEIVNEPNLAGYWRPLSLKLLMDVFVTPATDVLKAAGIETLSPAAAGSTDTTQKLAGLGLATDGYAFHPYCPKTTDLISMMGRLLKVTGAERVDLTEWNARRGQDYKHGLLTAAEVVEIQQSQWGVLRTLPTVRHVCYFALTVPGKETENSPLQLLRKDADAVRETEYSRDFWAKVA